jgi:trimeric autotransporter adhesin
LVRRCLTVLAGSQAKEIRMIRTALATSALILLAGAGRVHGAPLPNPQSGPALTGTSRPAVADQVSVPRLVQFSGTLKDSSARSISGPASVTFAIYAEQDGGTALWSETQNVLADANGHYNVLLGAASANGGLPADLFTTGSGTGSASAQSRWLGVTVAREPELPRVLLASVPYALKAADADTLGGLPASAYVTTQQLAARPAQTIIATGASIARAAATDPASTQSQVSTSNSVTQATPSGGGTTNFLPLWTSATNLGSSKLFQSTGGNIGVGTTAPVVLLDVNGDSIFRGSFQLVPQATATAASGQPSHSYQWEASSYNSSTKEAVTTAYGFRATPQGNNTASPTSSLDLYYGPGGGTLTDLGLSISNTGLITFVPGQTFPGASVSVNEVSVPDSTSATNGVISIGGTPFLSDYGSSVNLFVGRAAGGFGTGNVTANPGYNTGAGAAALHGLTSGYENSAFGSLSLSSLTSGNQNSAVGVIALANAVGGSNNSAFGYNSGATVQAGSGNTLIGAGTDVVSDAVSNSTAIGENAQVGESNALVLGGTGSNAVNVGIGTPTPHSALDIVSATVTSSSPTPAPTLTLSNTAGGQGSNVSIDFNTSAPAYTANYNPNARILVVDEGNFTDGIYFQANRQGATNNGLYNNMVLYGTGAVEIDGDLNVYGNLYKNGGAFKIDDPIAPAEKYLSHSFVESPDMMNIYNGNVITDANGFATVTMPAWFEALNADFRYQLTTVGQFAQAMIATEMQNGQFTIQTDKPNVKVSWMVTGIRHDAWANAHRIPNEEEKPADKKGHYMHPELYGAAPEK